ncbi:hypothetical protein AAA799B03_00989 [Marine Group I thaumarchaeote SCGC AAA799-B03]|uniref:Uncharacterized protein n=3 Tax=Marine Group I TaxID=905826 RepID=A0A087S6W2_9ARCH|nr:hypothetical protein AAA799N04_01045 [Marine Group I thaumarchaeote SCGC AAA799-N04]KFM16839.1 hypothetical protein SCCGRSA3_02042 [Marine Group I thaumarchaeote SCGC RSA3]KFM21466.1 hypothetical protein AAA799B03_00989 [Marine Group I thaumarchaeote SCGC AAA799-B03]
MEWELSKGVLESMSECPKCGGDDIAMILWGTPKFSSELKDKVKQKKIILGGCEVSRNNPELECNDCGFRFSK